MVDKSALIVSDDSRPTSDINAALWNLCADLMIRIRESAGTFVLTGAAGTGKSLVAEQIARQLRSAGWRLATGYTAGRDFTALLTLLSTALETPSGSDLL